VTTTTTTSTIDVETGLARCAAMTSDAVARYLPGDGPEAYLGAPVGDYLARGGKGLRPALCLATCEAFGGEVEDALGIAAAIELMHTAFLVHDDIEDGSEMRRGLPTLHRRYGMPLALNAGDALAAYSLGAVHDAATRLGGRIADRIVGEFAFMARQTVEGQALELGWRIDNRLDLGPDDYLELIMKKTCWYTTVLPLRLGALIGSGGTADLEPFVAFGFNLGAAFQIRDDVLNLAGDSVVYGKEPNGDLYEGKRTLVLIHLLTTVDPARRSELERFLAKDRQHRTAAEVDKVRGWIDEHGSIAFAREFARGIAASAVVAFEAAFAAVPASPARRFLAAMIPYMVERAR
jgi:geranylgeranyl diphosphate synthase type II